ncbi:MAG: metallophosphoesterase [Syntrophotaleaceae bacterium]
MTKAYYFISDLHIGGDEALGVCDYEQELIAFLEDLAGRRENAELLLIGDIFGLWEFTDIQGPEKLNAVMDQFPGIFSALQKAGETIRVTMLPGNHDYEIACYPEFVDLLKSLNICLEQSPAITRKLGQHGIWIEHGNQQDAYNRMRDFGNPHAQPVGYFITSSIVSSAGKHSKFGRYNWLKDIQSVYPSEQIPHWIMSNYFYNEMSPLLRWLILPFLLFSGLEIFVLGGAALEWFDLTDTNIFLNNRILSGLGVLGNLVQIIFIINTFLFLCLLALAVPLYLVWRDFRKALKRFRIIVDPSELSSEKEQQYLDAALRVFEQNPETAVYVYGPTQSPSLRRVGRRAVINTGTWLKKFDAVSTRLKFLPKVYVPSYCLNYFRMSEAEGRVVIEYSRIDKQPPKDLSLLQRLLIYGKRRKTEEDIPSRTVLDVA